MYAGIVALTTSATTQTITGLPARPKALTLFGGAPTALDVPQQPAFQCAAYGVVVETAPSTLVQRGSGRYTQNASSTLYAGLAVFDNACFMIDYGTLTADRMLARVREFTDDGFILDFFETDGTTPKTPPQAFHITYQAHYWESCELVNLSLATTGVVTQSVSLPETNRGLILFGGVQTAAVGAFVADLAFEVGLVIGTTQRTYCATINNGTDDVGCAYLQNLGTAEIRDNVAQLSRTATVTISATEVSIDNTVTSTLRGAGVIGLAFSTERYLQPVDWTLAASTGRQTVAGATERPGVFFGVLTGRPSADAGVVSPDPSGVSLTVLTEHPSNTLQGSTFSWGVSGNDGSTEQAQLARDGAFMGLATGNQFVVNGTSGQFENDGVSYLFTAAPAAVAGFGFFAGQPLSSLPNRAPGVGEPFDCGAGLDPEFLQDQDLVIYQSGTNVLVRDVDPATGAFTGLPVTAATNLAPITTSRKGPLFGWDANGAGIYYSATVGDQQQWWTVPQDGAGWGTPVALTTDVTRVNLLPTQIADGTTVYLGGAREVAPGQLVLCYLDEVSVATNVDLTPVAAGFSGFRWLFNSSLMYYTLGDGPNAGQVAVVDASTGTTGTVVTSDPGIKFDAFPWDAPDGQRHFSAQLGQNGSIAVYTEQLDGTYTQTQVYDPPVGELQYTQSAEPFTVGANSYLILTLKDANLPIADCADGQIWIIEVSTGRWGRVDGGEPGLVRSEGEVYFGAGGQLYVYWSDITTTPRTWGASVDLAQLFPAGDADTVLPFPAIAPTATVAQDVEPGDIAAVMEPPVPVVYLAATSEQVTVDPGDIAAQLTLPVITPTADLVDTLGTVAAEALLPVITPVATVAPDEESTMPAYYYYRPGGLRTTGPSSMTTREGDWSLANCYGQVDTAANQLILNGSDGDVVVLDNGLNVVDNGQFINGNAVRTFSVESRSLDPNLCELRMDGAFSLLQFASAAAIKPKVRGIRLSRVNGTGQNLQLISFSSGVGDAEVEDCILADTTWELLSNQQLGQAVASQTTGRTVTMRRVTWEGLSILPSGAGSRSGPFIDALPGHTINLVDNTWVNVRSRTQDGTRRAFAYPRGGTIRVIRGSFHGCVLECLTPNQAPSMLEDHVDGTLEVVGPIDVYDNVAYSANGSASGLFLRVAESTNTTVKGVRFFRNRCEGELAEGEFGGNGGMVLVIGTTARAHIEDCEAYDNEGFHGALIYWSGGAGGSAKRCTVARNKGDGVNAVKEGFGIYVGGGGTDLAGGEYGNADVELESIMVLDHEAPMLENRCSALYIHNGGPAGDGSRRVTMKHITFAGNASTSEQPAMRALANGSNDGGVVLQVDMQDVVFGKGQHATFDQNVTDAEHQLVVNLSNVVCEDSYETQILAEPGNPPTINAHAIIEAPVLSRAMRADVYSDTPRGDSRDASGEPFEPRPALGALRAERIRATSEMAHVFVGGGVEYSDWIRVLGDVALVVEGTLDGATVSLQRSVGGDFGDAADAASLTDEGIAHTSPALVEGVYVRLATTGGGTAQYVTAYVTPA